MMCQWLTLSWQFMSSTATDVGPHSTCVHFYYNPQRSTSRSEYDNFRYLETVVTEREHAVLEDLDH